MASGRYDVRDCPENDLVYSKGLPHPKGKPVSDFVSKVEEERERFKKLAESVDLD